MKKSRLINIFKTLTKKEVRDLRKWLHSPAHNQREDTVFLFEYLVAEDNMQQESLLDKSTVFKHIFPDESQYDDAKIRQVMYFLLKSMEDYLIYEELIQDKIRTQAALVNIFRKKELWKYCEQTIKSVNEKQDKADRKDSRYFRNAYILEREKYLFSSENNRVSPNLQEMSDALDLTFIADKMRQMCLMLSHQKVYKKEYDIAFYEEIIREIENKKLLNRPAVAVYYYIHKALTAEEGGDIYFLKLKLEIENNIDFFSQSEQRDIFLFTINYCISKINAGEKSFIREAFNLYKKGFERGVLFENGLISRWTFLNVLTNSFLLKEYKWAEEAIQKYQNNIEEQYRKNTVHYATAKLQFEQKNYDAAMDLLTQYEYDDILMNLNAKSMLLKIYYETNEFIALEALIASTRTFVNRKKMMSYHKGGVKSFLKMISKLMKLNVFSRKEKEKLNETILAVQPIFPNDRSWLLEQLTKV